MLLAGVGAVGCVLVWCCVLLVLGVRCCLLVLWLPVALRCEVALRVLAFFVCGCVVVWLALRVCWWLLRLFACSAMSCFEVGVDAVGRGPDACMPTGRPLVV